MATAPMNWSPANKAKLIHLHAKGLSYKAIAAALGATTWACSQRISLLRREGTVIAYRQAGGGRRVGSARNRPAASCNQPPIETDDDEDVSAAEACDGHLADLQRCKRRWVTEARA